MQINLLIPGQPIAQKRHRTTVRGGFARTYDPQSAEKAAVASIITKQFRYCPTIPQEIAQMPLEGAISIRMTFYKEIAKTGSKAKKQAKLLNEAYNTGHIDLDNYCKFYMDCMNMLVYVDDSQIVELHASKHWGINPRTEIEIKTVI